MSPRLTVKLDSVTVSLIYIGLVTSPTFIDIDILIYMLKQKALSLEFAHYTYFLISRKIIKQPIIAKEKNIYIKLPLLNEKMVRFNFDKTGT